MIKVEYRFNLGGTNFARSVDMHGQVPRTGEQITFEDATHLYTYRIDSVRWFVYVRDDSPFDGCDYAILELGEPIGLEQRSHG